MCSDQLDHVRFYLNLVVINAAGGYCCFSQKYLRYMKLSKHLYFIVLNPFKITVCEFIVVYVLFM